MKPLFMLLIEIFFLLCYTIGFVCVIIILSKSTQVRLDYIESLAKNWNSTPVLNVYSSEVNELCKKGSSPFINDTWAGTIEMCKQRDFISRGPACSKNSVHYTKIEPVVYKNWRDTNLCAERMTGNYFNLTIATNDNKCPLNYKSCGVIDSMNNIMCGPVNTKCPYNKVEFIPSGQPLPSDANYTSIPLKDKTLVLANTQDGSRKIVTEFLVSEDTPCADSYYKNYIGELFIAEVHSEDRDKCKEKLGGNLLDPRTEFKDEYSYYETYNKNGILYLMKSKYSFFANYSNTLKSSQRTLKLFQRPYIGIKTHCLDEIRVLGLQNQLIEDLALLSSELDGWNTLALFAVVAASIGLVLLYLYAAFIIYCLFTQEFSDEDLKGRVFVHLFINVFTLIWLILAIIMLAYVGSIGTSYTFLTQNNCADDITTEALLSGETFRSSFKGSLVMIVMVGVLLIISNCVSIFIACFI